VGQGLESQRGLGGVGCKGRAGERVVSEKEIAGAGLGAWVGDGGVDPFKTASFTTPPSHWLVPCFRRIVLTHSLYTCCVSCRGRAGAKIPSDPRLASRTRDAI
jgi:hypothetical protein